MLYYYRSINCSVRIMRYGQIREYIRKNNSTMKYKMKKLNNERAPIQNTDYNIQFNALKIDPGGCGFLKF